jgi:hypothetical protein
MATLPEPVGTVEPQTYTLAFQGVETAPGTPDYNMDTLVGINYAGEASGPLTGALSFSFSQKSLVFDASGGNDLNGNTWSLVVFKDGECQGVVFGEITGGRATWSKDGSGRLDGALVVKGGSGAFVDAAKIQAAGWFKLLRVKDASGQQIISGTVEMSF